MECYFLKSDCALAVLLYGPVGFQEGVVWVGLIFGNVGTLIIIFAFFLFLFSFFLMGLFSRLVITHYRGLLWKRGMEWHGIAILGEPEDGDSCFTP